MSDARACGQQNKQGEKMILYFSGTGNSAYVAKRIAKCLDDSALDLFDRIRADVGNPCGSPGGNPCGSIGGSISAESAALHSDRPFVVVAPTYGWQLPHIVRDWIRKVDFSGSRSFYFVLTCGDSIGNAGVYAKRLCDEKGFAYMGCAEVVMPENYLAMFPVPDEEKSRRIVEKAFPVIDAIAGRISRGERLEHKPGLLSKVLSGPVNSFFYRFVIGDKKFTVSEDCIRCGKCERECPTGNIDCTGGMPKWNGNCIHCMRCITKCPTGAIEYGKKSVGKPRYHCPYSLS